MAKKKIIIVGGGLAGLVACYEIAKTKRYKVQLIEARSRLGGRVYTEKIKKVPVDYGGFIIYPWYRICHSLIKELGISDDLQKIPLHEIYYDIEGNGNYLRIKDIDFPIFEKLKMWIKALPDLLTHCALLDPEFKSFKEQTIEEYINKISRGSSAGAIYKSLFDSSCQGYCYGSIDQYRLSFILPIFTQTFLHGDIKSAHFFPKGTSLMIEKLTEKIERLGVEIHLNKEVNDINDLKADGIVFAQTVSSNLYKQLFPTLKTDWEYTNFCAATLHLDHTPAVNSFDDWGAIFYKPDKKKKLQILSAINLKSLYSKKLARFVNVNIAIKYKLIGNLSKDSLFKLLKKDVEILFPENMCKGISNMVHWQKAMPVATENFVKFVQSRQGFNNHYFAGDYLGCPSMEVALASGAQAAENLLENVK